MRFKENYAPFIATAFGLTVSVLVIFQIYLFGEPARIQAQERADQAAAVAAGRDLYRQNCTACHGNNGEGNIGPALNSRQLLNMTSDEALANLIRTGVPGTVMPAWGQAFGGPFTDEQTTQIVVFIRDWEPTAPEIAPVTDEPDPVRGATIYAQTCFVCHGENGRGTDRAPALNDPERLAAFDDAWYRNTIAHGRPAKGMPTWGTVLSPAQIDDVVALLAVWREGGTVSPDISLAMYLSSALNAIREFDRVDAEFYLNEALKRADDSQTEEIRAIIKLVQENQLFVAQTRIAALLDAEEMGRALFATHCAACHGDDGTGAIGPNLHDNAFVQSLNDDALVAFLLAGRKGTAMAGFEGRLTEEELRNVLLLLRAWQE